VGLTFIVRTRLIRFPLRTGRDTDRVELLLECRGSDDAVDDGHADDTTTVGRGHGAQDDADRRTVKVHGASLEY
jgi:hypothetical protein